MEPAAALEAALEPIASTGLPDQSSIQDPLQAHTAHGLSGRWRKDRALSDDMGPACDAVSLPWLLRKALRILNVLEVEDCPDHFRTKVKAGGLMDVVECYPWDGSERTFGRRDKRRQPQTGSVSREGDKPKINVRWSDPYGGRCTDEFALSEDGMTLTQSTTMAMNEEERSCQYRTVYRRERFY